ncbi:MAG: hypothetical protein ACOCRN_05325, partial [Spirochaetia bacterium]
GLVERMDRHRQEYGEERLKAALASAPDSSAQEVADYLVREALRWASEDPLHAGGASGSTAENGRMSANRDDITVIVLRYVGDNA